MEKFTGENCEDNRIEIDFDKKQVLFTPVSKRGVMGNYLMFLINSFGLLISNVGAPVLIFYLIGTVVVPINMQGYYMEKLFKEVGIIIFLFSTLLSLQFFMPNWRKNYYPIFMYGILSKKRKITITPKQMVFEKAVYLPKFSNIGLNYELTEDFAEHIKEIRLKDKFIEEKERPDYHCLFTFKRKILKGEMKLEYL